MSRERLHKVLAAAGIASRRRCEELIAEGRVTVDGREITTQGFLVDAETQDIRFDGERIRAEPPAYFLVNKPVGYLSTTHDEYGRRTVVSLVRDHMNRRLYTVGRLDEESEGLIIVTNDGEFANRVAHPRYGVEKTYALKLYGFLDDDALDRVRKGVWLSEGRSPSMWVKVEKRSKQYTNVIVRISEGRNRILRRVFAKVGHAVSRLKRVRIGNIGMTGVSRGGSRRLTKEEVASLLASCEENRERAPSGPRHRGGDRAHDAIARRGHRKPDARAGGTGRSGSGGDRSSDRRGGGGSGRGRSGGPSSGNRDSSGGGRSGGPSRGRGGSGGGRSGGPSRRGRGGSGGGRGHSGGGRGGSGGGRGGSGGGRGR